MRIKECKAAKKLDYHALSNEVSEVIHLFSFFFNTTA